jgi:hypothetical protein
MLLYFDGVECAEDGNLVDVNGHMHDVIGGTQTCA